MKEFIEKLIGRLEEQKSDLTTWAEDKAFEIGIETAVSIVKQLAEEFATDKNVGHNDQDLMIVESLPSLYPMMQPFEEEAVYRVVERAKYNNGWTPCSKELPPQPKSNLLFENKPLELYLATVRGSDYAWRVFWNGECFTDGWNKVDVIAWQPLPEPFKG